MRGQEPLADWLYGDREYEDDLRSGRDVVRRTLEVVQRLEQWLADVPAGGKTNFEGVRLFRFSFAPICFSVTELERLARVYRIVVNVRGTGSARLQEDLLRVMGRTGAPSLVPFWSELLTIKKARDPFSNKRRALALAALAYVVIRAPEPLVTDAVAALEAGLRHKGAVTRGEAAYYLATAFVERGESAPEEILDSLRSCARKKGALAPRYFARRALAALGSPLPTEPVDGVYAFKVWHHLDETTYRVVEVESKQSLDTLHSAIQQAWNWGNDHLYVFYVDGALRDERFEYAHDVVDEAGGYAMGIQIGELGLRPRHRLLYIFDFGNNHRFTVQCVKVRDRTGPGPFPRVVEAVGEPLAQYPAWYESER